MVDFDDLQILREQMDSKGDKRTLKIPKPHFTDIKNEKFASYSSGYLSQNSFVDLNQECDSIDKEEWPVVAPSLQQGDHVSKESNMAYNYNCMRLQPTKSMQSQTTSNEEDTQEIILPNTFSNEDEPMVLITKPCLPPGKKPMSSLTESRNCLSSSSTVASLMNHLSLKRDKKKSIEGRETKLTENSIAHGFSHLEWSASVPYNLAEEPDVCKGMKHSHSCQSMPSVSEEKKSNPLQSTEESKYGGEYYDRLESTRGSITKKTDLTEHSIQDNVENNLAKNEDRKESTQILDSDVCKKLPQNENENFRGKGNESRDRVALSMKQDITACLGINDTLNINSKDFEPHKRTLMNKENAVYSKVVDLQKENDGASCQYEPSTQHKIVHHPAPGSRSFEKESLEKKRIREQEILIKKLDEFRKNSRSTKADQITICTNRQMRARSEDIIIKSSIDTSNKNHKNGVKQANSAPKEHSSSFEQFSKTSDIDKQLSKLQQTSQRPTDKIETNRRRLRSDSYVYYSKSKEIISDNTDAIKLNTMSKLDHQDMPKFANKSDESTIYQLNAPKLVQAISLNSSPTQAKSLKNKCDNLNDQNSTSKKKKSLALPSPPVEFRDPPQISKIQRNSLVEEVQAGKCDAKLERDIPTDIKDNQNKDSSLPDACTFDNSYNRVKEGSDEKETINVKEKVQLNIDSTKDVCKDSTTKPSLKKCGGPSDLVRRKNNIFAHHRINTFTSSEDSAESKTMNFSQKNASLNQENELFVVGRRGSTEDCLENTPLPTSNLLDPLKVSYSHYTCPKNTLQSSPLSASVCSSSRLGVKR